MNNFDIKAANWDNDPVKHERAELFANEIRNIENISIKNALEYGCGTGLVSFNLYKYFNHITLCDSSREMLNELQNKINEKQISNMSPVFLDLEKDEGLNDKYDVVYTLMTLHHIIDLDMIIKKFHFVLNDRGYLFIADLENEDGSFHGKDFKGHKGFETNLLNKKLEDAGFEIIKNSTYYKMKKKDEHGIEKTFPLFLLKAQKYG